MVQIGTIIDNILVMYIFRFVQVAIILILSPRSKFNIFEQSEKSVFRPRLTRGTENRNSFFVFFNEKYTNTSTLSASYPGTSQCVL